MPSRRRSLARIAALLPAMLVSLFAVSSHAVRQGSAPSSPPLAVPDGFVIERIAGKAMLSYPMFGVQDDDGRLFVFESTEPNTMTTEAMLAAPSYHIRVLEDGDGDGTFDKSTIYADKLPFPKGGAFVDGSLFVSAAPHLLRLKDTDGDLVADERETVVSGWTLNVNGATLGGPFLGPDGWLYLTDARRGFAITRKEGDTLQGRGARIWRVRPDGSGLEWIAGGGFDNAIELIFMPSGDTVGTMTYFMEPKDGLRDALMHWVEGGVYPKPNEVIAADRLPLTGDLLPPMTMLARVAPSGLLRYRGSALGAGFHGNLFSAQFNTGRVMRHVVTPEGSTYRTEDLPFVTATAPDVHPTDVLQDADGSLIVIETGGWFIKGCPLSRVAKPEIAGGIYRIRKAGAPAVPDPRGRRISFETTTPARLGGLLADPRPVVRDKALEALVRRGEAAVPVLTSARRTASDVEVRAARGVRAAPHRHAGGARGGARRAGRPRCQCPRRRGAQRRPGQGRRGPADAAARRGHRCASRPPAGGHCPRADRRHPGRPRVAEGVRNAGRPLCRARRHPRADHPARPGAAGHRTDIVIGQRASRRADRPRPDAGCATPAGARAAVPGVHRRLLWRTGIWAASHHPGWSDLIVSGVRARLDAPTLADADAAVLRDVMVSVCKDGDVQGFVARGIGGARTPLLLDVMQACAVDKTPAVWVDALRRQLASQDEGARAGAMRLVAGRRIEALAGDLSRDCRRRGGLAGAAVRGAVGIGARSSSTRPVIVRLALDTTGKDRLRTRAAAGRRASWPRRR